MAKVSAQREAGRTGPVRAVVRKRAKSMSEAEVVVTREQVFEAVRRLPPEDKAKLVELLEADIQKAYQDFGEALRTIGREYRNISLRQVEKDVAEAIRQARLDRAPGGRG